MNATGTTLLISEQFDAAADLCERGWTQGPFAVEENGKPTSASGTNACKWCMYGAMIRVTSGNLEDAEQFYMDNFYDEEIRFTLVAYNEHADCTQEKAVTRLREAAERARKAGK